MRAFWCLWAEGNLVYVCAAETLWDVSHSGAVRCFQLVFGRYACFPCHGWKIVFNRCQQRWELVQAAFSSLWWSKLLLGEFRHFAACLLNQNFKYKSKFKKKNSLNKLEKCSQMAALIYSGRPFLSEGSFFYELRAMCEQTKTDPRGRPLLIIPRIFHSQHAHTPPNHIQSGAVYVHSEANCPNRLWLCRKVIRKQIPLNFAVAPNA